MKNAKKELCFLQETPRFFRMFAKNWKIALHKKLYFCRYKKIKVVHFSKYHGTGNDFIVLDNRTRSINITEKEVRKLCHRRYGIGADGLMLLNPSEQFDFEMVYYNSDGSSDTMCGNGGRCIAAFARHLEIIGRKGCFEAYDGLHHVEIISENGYETNVKISMRDCPMPQKLSEDLFFIHTGAPHLVVFCCNIEAIDVPKLGKKLSNDIAGRTNVNFVEIKPDHLVVRTFERGVEDETLSCGTGITASALAYSAGYLPDIQQNVLSVISFGGWLKVHYSKNNDIFQAIHLEGHATFVFSGETS